MAVISERPNQSSRSRIAGLASGPGYPEALEAVEYLRQQATFRPRVGMVLGSGLGQLTRGLVQAQRIPYQSIPHFPQPSVEGHTGALWLGLWEKVPVVVLEGRGHLYEGLRPAQVVFPIRVLALLGVRTVVMTCAAGGIAPRARPGWIMAFADHLNFQGASPLAGSGDPRWGKRFVDLTQAYDPDLRRQARKLAQRLRLKWFEGIYAAVLGPNYETPAEIRALRRLGADAVGMSTVPEVIAARQSGLAVLAMAVITNRAAGLARRPISHEEVLETAQGAVVESLGRLLGVLVAKL